MKGIIFDLDGTLLYTLKDLADSTNAALRDLGKPEHPVESYRLFVGNGARMLCRRALGGVPDNDPNIEKMLEGFRHYYALYQKNTTVPYEGMTEVLAKLNEAGILCAILSNKPQPNTQVIAESYFPAGTFTCVVGQSDEVPPKPDPTGVRKVLSDFGLPLSEVYYLGDSGVDMITAKQAGLTAVGALWGYRDEKELLENGADLLIHSPQDLLKL